MPSDDPGPEWIISNCLPTTSSDRTNQKELVISARRVWPYVHAHANRELGDRRDDPENVTLAVEVWEGVLQSIAKSLHRLRTSCAEIANMDSYLIGAFRHRFNRARRRQQKRERTIRLFASANELDVLAAKRGLRTSVDFEARVLAKEIFALMDAWVRRVWTARQYGYSWKEIAEYLGAGEQRTKMKFRYKLSVVRSRLGG
jgi:DNA-directed RNA polymerase specialized sigma24 family protein